MAIRAFFTKLGDLLCFLKKSKGGLTHFSLPLPLVARLDIFIARRVTKDSQMLRKPLVKIPCSFCQPFLIFLSCTCDLN